MSNRRVADALAGLESALALALLAFVVVVNTVQVVWRAGLDDPLSWTEEAARVAFVWLVYVGVVRAVRRRTHLSVDFFVKRLPPGAQRAVAVANHAIYVVFFAVVLAQAVKLTLHTWGMSLAVLPLPAATIYVAGVLSGTLSLVHLALQWRVAATPTGGA